MLSSQKGFTLIGVLFLMVVFGIAHMGVNSYWSTAIKRENEAALLFRGNQIKKSIESYYNSAKGGRNKSYPRNLESLLKDPRYMSVKRHLRKIYREPFSGDGEWGVIRDASGRIRGVFSKSTKKPLKVSNFSKENTHFEKAKTYSDWRFVYGQKSSGKKQ